VVKGTLVTHNGQIVHPSLSPPASPPASQAS